MRIGPSGLSLVAVLALGSAAAAQSQSEPQQLPQPKVSSEQRYCLTEKTSGAVNCGFATMAECQQAANVGRDGDCELNPRITTGSGTRQ